MPIHENVIRNYVNIEIFHRDDLERKDCLGWITIMEKAAEDLRKGLKEERIGLEERKKIEQGIRGGNVYLANIGILSRMCHKKALASKHDLCIYLAHQDGLMMDLEKHRQILKQIIIER